LLTTKLWMKNVIFLIFNIDNVQTTEQQQSDEIYFYVHIENHTEREEKWKKYDERRDENKIDIEKLVCNFVKNVVDARSLFANLSSDIVPIIYIISHYMIEKFVMMIIIIHFISTFIEWNVTNHLAVHCGVKI
jgi:hypothetical protein